MSLLAVVLALGVNAVLNIVFPRPRPFLVLSAHVLVPSPPQDSTFPSDHVAVASAIAVTLLWGAETGWGIFGLFVALLIGASRVVVGVHYPSDILGGVFVGAVCAWIVFLAEIPLRPLLNRTIALARRFRLA